MKLPLAVLASEVSLAHRAKPDACDRCCNLHNRMDLRGCCVSGPLPLLQQFWHKDLQRVDKACCWKESDGVIHIKLERTHAHARQHASSEVLATAFGGNVAPVLQGGVAFHQGG